MQIQPITFYNQSKFKKKSDVTFVKNYNSQPITNSSNYIHPFFSFGANFLTRIEGLSCPSCAVKMTTSEKFSSILTKEALSGSSQKSIETISNFEQNLHPTERNCLNIIKKISNKFPNSTLQELLIKEAPKHLERLQLRQLKVLDRIDIHLKNLAPDLKQQVAKITQDARIIIGEQEDLFTDKTTFKRKVIINAFEALKNSNPDSIALKEIYNFSSSLPNSSNDVDSFFVKYSRRSSVEIGQRLVSKSVSTIEHIKPQSKDGASTAENYLGECAGCNNMRGSILLNDWIAMNKKMLKNIQLYMQEVIELIKIGRIKDHDNYPDQVLLTIKQETIGNELKKDKPNKYLVDAFNLLISNLENQIKIYKKDKKG